MKKVAKVCRVCVLRHLLFVVAMVLATVHTSTGANRSLLNNPPKNAGVTNISYQVDSYDCQTGVLHFHLIGGDGSFIHVVIPGIFAGDVHAGDDITTTFAPDGRTGSDVTGTATQSGSPLLNISIPRTCGSPTTPPTTPPASGGGLAFNVITYDCNSGLLHYKMTGGDGTPVYVVFPGGFAATVNQGEDNTAVIDQIFRTNNNFTGRATQSGVTKDNLLFPANCSYNTTPPTNPVTPPTNPPANPSGGDYRSNLETADCNTISGWAFDNNHTQQSISVDVYINGQKAATVLASNDRGDVSTAYNIVGYSKYGFSWTIPDQYKNNSTLTIAVKYAGTSTDVSGGPKTAGGCPVITTTPPTNPTPTANCSFTEGQHLFDFYGEQMYAHFYNGILFAAYQDASQGFKPQHWISAAAGTANFDPNKVACFAESDPRLPGSKPSGDPVGRPLFDGDPNLLPDWKWYDQEYNVFYKFGGVINEKAYSPFKNAGTIVQYDDKEEEDGWMLVARDFGLSQDEASKIRRDQDAVALPFFVLYNRYTGKLRVFIYNPSTETEYTHHSVTLSLLSTDPNPPKNPALFAFNNRDSTQLFVDNYDPKLTLTTLTGATKRSWSIADFNLSYYDDRIFSTSMFDNFVLSIDISNLKLTTTTLKGDLTLDGNVQPKSLSQFNDLTNTLSTFGIKAFDEVPKLVSAFTVDEIAKKAIEFGPGIGSALGLISAGSDLLNGLFGGSGGYDVSLAGKINLDGISKVYTGGSVYQIYLKRHFPRRADNIYDPVQDIPWGIIGLKQFPTVEVAGHYEDNGQRVYTNESGKSEEIRLINYHAHGFPIVPVMRPIRVPEVANANGIVLSTTEAAYFLPDGTPTPHSFGLKVATYDNPPPFPLGYHSPSEFESTEYSFVVLTKIPYSKVGINFTFRPVNPTKNLSGPLTIYKVFNVPTHITLYQDGYYSIQPPVSNREARQGNVEETEGASSKPYPNPFRESVQIPMNGTQIGEAYTVQITSLDGKIIWTDQGNVSDSSSSIRWNGTNAAGSNVEPGMYITKVTLNNNRTIVHKIILAK